MKGVFDGNFSGHRHDMDLPQGCEDFFVMVTVRNPYSRAVSLWYHRLREIRWELYKGMHPKERRRQPLPYERLSFEEYMRWIMNGEAPDFFSFTCCRWLKWVKNVNYVLKMEELRRLNELGLGAYEVKVPKLNKTTHGDWRDAYAGRRDLVSHVWGWAREDFLRFGYDSESWIQSEYSLSPTSVAKVTPS